MSMVGTSRPCLRGTVERATHECGSDEPITRTRSVCFLSKNHSVTFTMIRTPSSYVFHEEIDHQYDDGNQKHDRGLRGPKKTISNSNVSMRLFGSTGEPDVLSDGIWDGGLVVSLSKSKDPLT
jgi:hypothetical protein